MAASMLLLLKINKQSFYLHYFKVIEEVELRNSQELLPVEGLTVWREVLPQLGKPFLSWLTACLSLFAGLGLFHISWILSYEEPQTRQLDLQWSHVIPPVRAP